MSDLERSWKARERELKDRLCGVIEMLQNAADALREAHLHLSGRVQADTILAEEIIRDVIKETCPAYQPGDEGDFKNRMMGKWPVSDTEDWTFCQSCGARLTDENMNADGCKHGAGRTVVTVIKSRVATEDAKPGRENQTYHGGMSHDLPRNP